MLDRYLTKATLKHRTLLTLYSAVVYGNTSPELTSLKYVNVSPTNPSGGTHGEVTRGRWAGSPIFKLHVELLVFKLTEKLDFKLCSNFSAICVEDFFLSQYSLQGSLLVRLSYLGDQVPDTLKAEFIRSEETDFANRFIYWPIRPNDSIPYRQNLCMLRITVNQLKDEIPIWCG